MLHPIDAPAPSIDRAVARLARRLRRDGGPRDWSPTPPALLIDWIEAALAGRPPR